MVKNLKEKKEINRLAKQSLLQTKKTGKAGAKSGKNIAKKPAARGSKAKNKKGSKKKASGNKAKAKDKSRGTKEKEDSSKEKEKNDPCKSVTNESFTSCHPSNPGSCGCGASMDYTVSSIPWGADWPVNFPLSQLRSMCQPWVFTQKPLIPGYPRSWVAD